ncbi:RNA polymerase sigma factor [Shouchella clausii]|uniref:RNA polymerase sigma factor n=1 Tax=Shouchella clausii TaxID=79880 RepID=UPI001C72B897|nr:sigma-70 family RNA polymerase sigma factor [Shouchella clausii]MBX0320171.1 sigma-70 family RNA polymerase sigma factor [Shouchella clausii]
MGAVTFDLKKDEIQYMNFGLHNVSEIKEVANSLDMIYLSRSLGNAEASALYNDFISLMSQIKDSRFIRAYHDVKIGIIASKKLKAARQLGESPKPFEGTPEEEAAHLLDISVEEMQEGLLTNYQAMSDQAYSQWATYIQAYANSYNKSKAKLSTKPSQWSKDLTLNTEKLIELDQLKKHVHPRHAYRKSFEPTSLSELENYRKTIAKKLSESKKKAIKYKEINPSLFTEYRNEYKKLAAIKIQVDKDIGLLKKIHKLPVGNQNQKGKKEMISYESSFDAPLYDDYNKKECVLEQIQDIKKEQLLEKIRSLAEKTLTPKQQVVFHLYYFLGLKMKEIADMIGVSQPAVKQQLNTIVKKIRREFEKTL